MTYFIRVDNITGKYTASSIEHPFVIGVGSSLDSALENLERQISQQKRSFSVEKGLSFGAEIDETKSDIDRDNGPDYGLDISKQSRLNLGAPEDLLKMNELSAGEKEDEYSNQVALPGRVKYLISTLKSQHAEIKRQLWIIHMLFLRRHWADCEPTRDRVLDFEHLIRAYFEEEESTLQILLPLISLREALDEQVLVSEFREHKRILGSFEKLRNAAYSLQLESQLWSNIEEIESDCSIHMKQEEEVLFPLVLYRVNQKDSSSDWIRKSQESLIV